MDAAIKHLEEEKRKRKAGGSGQGNRNTKKVETAGVVGGMSKAQSSQRLMNSSGSSFKAPQATSSDVRAGAQEDLDRLSMNSSRAKMKTTAPRNLKPIPGKTAGSGPSLPTKKVVAPKSTKPAQDSSIVVSDSLKHKRAAGGADQGAIIDMGLGGGIGFNQKKKEKKDIMRNIDMDVNQFMKDFEE